MTAAEVAETRPPKGLNLFERRLSPWVVGVLVEVPVRLSVCAVCNRMRGWVDQTQSESPVSIP